MTRLLALDTSAAACSVALLQDTHIDECFELAARDHTRLILPMVDELLTRHGLSLGQLDGIAFGRGPGSFTGLRICAGVVQGLAFGAGLPVLAVSSLAAVARGFFEQQSAPPQAPALVCMDARMDELYFAAYEDEPGGGVALQGEEQLLAPGDLRLGALKSVSRGLTALGSGWHYLSQMPDVMATDFAVIDCDVLPRARHIAQLGALLLHRGEVLQPQRAEPVYLRQQVAWKKSAKALTKTSKTSKGA
jgi:tRNA threonylcarbamoyladenosine biosynthesis protein TsaB